MQSHTRTLLVAGLLLAGCDGGDELPRERISGAVTLDDKPLESGTIQFMPTSTTGVAVGGGAIITEGAYEIPKAQGLVPGAYRVNIFSPDSVAEADDGGPPGESKAKASKGDKPAKERIPARYNASSTLKADVAAGAKNTFDYELQSK